jgi:hypothetical protein
MQKLIYIFFISISFSCKSKEKVSSENPTANDTTLLASIERTPCFGKCATYKITIYQSGHVVYEGKQNVKNIGLFSTRLEKSKVDEIKNYILQNKILDLEDKYVNPKIADFPTTFTEANLNGKYKHITETDPHSPEQLKAYQKFLDSFFTEQTNWIPLSGNK